MTQRYFDDILTGIQTGKWNYIYFFGVGLLDFMVPSFVLAGSFLTPFVNHQCIPPLDKANVTGLELYQCSYNIIAEDFNETASLGKPEKCSKWSFDHDDFKTSITEEFELVCDNDYLRPTYQTLYMIGNFIGAPVNGFLSDRFGRRYSLITGVFLGVTSVLLSSFVTNFSMLLGLRFISGLSHPPIVQSGFILCMEVCEPKYRTVVGIAIALPWAIGIMWWGALGYFIDDWRWLVRASVVPGIVYIIFLFWFTDESPRWLIVQGKQEKAIEILKKAAAWNKTTLPSDEELKSKMLEIQKSSITKIEKPRIKLSGSRYWAYKAKQFLNRIIIVYKTREILRRTILVYIMFFVVSTVYYGLSLNAINFKLDPFMYMVINGITEIPAYTVPIPIIAKFGRVIPTAVSYFICGVTILTLAFIPQGPKWLIITFAMIGKFCISSCYQVVFLICSELFPTEVRLQALGTSNLVSRIGSIAAPYITDSLGPIYPWVPSVLFGSLSLAAAVATIFVPETVNEHLPETILNMEREAKVSKQRKKRKNGDNDEEAAEIITLDAQLLKYANHDVELDALK